MKRNCGFNFLIGLLVAVSVVIHYVTIHMQITVLKVKKRNNISSRDHNFGFKQEEGELSLLQYFSLKILLRPVRAHPEEA